jgi:hypothetical protein
MNATRVITAAAILAGLTFHAYADIALYHDEDVTGVPSYACVQSNGPGSCYNCQATTYQKKYLGNGIYATVPVASNVWPLSQCASCPPSGGTGCTQGGS